MLPLTKQCLLVNGGVRGAISQAVRDKGRRAGADLS